MKVENPNAVDFEIRSSGATLGTTVRVDGKLVHNVVDIHYRHHVNDVARLELYCIATNDSVISGLAGVTIFQIPLEVLVELQTLRNIVNQMAYDATAEERAKREQARHDAARLFLAKLRGEAGEVKEEGIREANSSAVQEEKETQDTSSRANELAQSAADSTSEVSVDGAREERDGVVGEGDA